MAKPIRKSEARRRKRTEVKPVLGRENFLIIGAGLLVILAGYIAMMEGSVEGFLPLVLAPILLILGYCVMIPFGIVYRKKGGSEKRSDPAGN